MKNRSLYALVIFLIIFSSFTLTGLLGPEINNQYINNAPKSSSNEIIVLSPENKSYTFPMSGYYPAIYGFENDANNVDPYGWTDFSGSGCTAQVITSLGSHNKVVELYDTNANAAAIRNDLPSGQASGTVEWWWRQSTTARWSNFWLNETLVPLVVVTLTNTGQIRVGSSIVYQDLQAYTSNTWYHMRVDFECGLGGYMGLASDTAYVYVNGVQYGPFTFSNPGLLVNRIHYQTESSLSNYYLYVDAIGYSWDTDYNIGDNFDEGLLLNFDNSTILDWIGYSLDEQSNKTIWGDITLKMPDAGHHSIQVFGNNTSGTMFESNIRYFSISYINIITPENKTYTTPMSGYYPATYGFENDNSGSNPQNWGTNEDSNTFIQVEDEFNGHKKVLTFLDQSSGGNCESWRDIGSQTSGYVDYWVAAEGIATIKMVTLTLRDGGVYGTVAFGLTVRTNYINPWNSVDPICQFASQEWVHIRLEFDCNTDIGDIYVNGIYNNSFPFVTAVTEIDCLRIETSYPDQSAEKVYFDAFGASWDSDYAQGDNQNEGLLVSYIKRPNLVWEGYSLNGAANKTIFGNTTIKIPSDGIHSIQVFANNTNNEYFQSDIRYFGVDLNPPEIIITLPKNYAYYDATPPTYSFSINEAFLNSTWYSLDGGITTFKFLGTTGTINETEWDRFGDGPIIVTFYANDSFGRLASSQVIVNKDTSAPIIDIIFPGDGDYYSVTAPIFNLSINEIYLNKTWYSLNGGLNILFSTLTDSLDQLIWDSLSDGLVTIRFYANDSSGQTSYSEVSTYKDATSPIITINQPLDLAEFTTPPIFNLTIVESNIESRWYTLSGSIDIYPFSNPIGSINPVAWAAFPDGPVTIRFYVRDLAGNQVFEEVTVIKQTSVSPPGISGYDLYILIGIISVVSVYLIRKKIKP